MSDTQEHEHDDELREIVEQVVENNPEAVADHRDGIEDAEHYLVHAVVKNLGMSAGEYDPEVIAEAVRDETGGGPPTTDEVRESVAGHVESADAALFVYVEFDDDGELTAQGSGRLFDGEAMSEAEQIAATHLLEKGVESLDIPRTLDADDEDDGPEMRAIPVSGDDLGGLLADSNSADGGDVPEWGAFQ